jgi:hypothetical protein
MPDSVLPGDTPEDPYGSRLVLLEDGIGLGPPHSAHETIASSGKGAYSHWYGVLYFAASDNSDPRSNGRQYQFYMPQQGTASARTERAIQVLRALPDSYGPADAYAAIERCLSILYPEARIGEDHKAFWDDVEFLNAYQRLCGTNYRALERKYTAYNLAKSVLWVGGDVAECGVYNGATAYFLARAIQESGEERQLFLFESFEGLSRPTAWDGSFWHAGALALPEEICRQNLAEFSNVHMLRGWIPERFNEVADRRFCFVHVDVDLFQPTKNSIEFFYPRLKPYGVLVCDDYGFTTCPGTKVAMDEFFVDKPERVIHLPTGQGLVIKQ